MEGPTAFKAKTLQTFPLETSALKIDEMPVER